MEKNLDKKDIEILKALDNNFRTSFSTIGKEVGLTKNSVRIRFEKLKNVMLHCTTGINYRLLGLNMVKIYCAIDLLDQNMELAIVKELKKYPSILYVARFYGYYNLEIGLYVSSFDELITQIESFNSKFSKNLMEKEVEIVSREYFLPNNFLYDDPKFDYKIVELNKKLCLSKNNKKIISFLRFNPRISALEISKKSKLSLKTVIENMKSMQKQGIIMGYFMMLDYSKFNLNISKVLIQLGHLTDEKVFEKYLSTLKNIKHFSKFVGLWDYEVDILYGSNIELQQQIEFIKSKFPKHIKRIEIINHGKRIFINKDQFLKE